MKPVAEMTDAEVLAAVRSGSCALVPVRKEAYAAVGHIGLDDFEEIDSVALLIELTQDEARFVAPQVII